MTRTERRFIDRAIKIGASKLAGAPSSIIEKIMQEEIDRALQYAQDDDNGGGVEVGAIDRAALPQPPELMMPDASPESKPRTELIPVDPKPAKGLILLPGQEGFESGAKGKPKVGVDEPLRVWRQPKDGIKKSRYQILRQEAISKMVELVNSKMPPVLQIIPVGCSSPVTIERVNTMADVVLGNVKVIYGFKGQSESSGSSGSGQKLGSATGADHMDPMRLSLLATQMFNIEDKTVNWEQRISDLRASSEEIFKPRSREIVNRTPAPNSNALSLANAAAYVDDTKDGGLVEIDSARASSEMEEFRRFQEAKRRGVIVPSLLG